MIKLVHTFAKLLLRGNHRFNPLIQQNKFSDSIVLAIGEGNGNPLQYSCLENPMGGGAWQAAVHGVAKSGTQLNDFPFTFHFPALEKEMATHSIVLAWRIPGTGEPGGLPSMGSHRVGHDRSDLAAVLAIILCNLLLMKVFVSFPCPQCMILFLHLRSLDTGAGNLHFLWFENLSTTH